MSFSPQSLLKPFSFSVLLTLCTGVALSAWADTIHFYNGKVQRGKIYRVTGDLIEFKPRFTQSQNIQRLTLTNRHDVVELRNGQKSFGEITYLDPFQVELATPTGRTKISRFFVRNLILGAPEAPPVNLPNNNNLPAARTGDVSGMNNHSYAPASPSNYQFAKPAVQTSDKPLVLFPSSSMNAEDRDAIPTEDRVP